MPTQKEKKAGRSQKISKTNKTTAHRIAERGKLTLPREETPIRLLINKWHSVWLEANSPSWKPIDPLPFRTFWLKKTIVTKLCVCLKKWPTIKMELHIRYKQTETLYLTKIYWKEYIEWLMWANFVNAMNVPYGGFVYNIGTRTFFCKTLTQSGRNMNLCSLNCDWE